MLQLKCISPTNSSLNVFFCPSNHPWKCQLVGLGSGRCFTALHCTTWHYTALHGTTRHYTALHSTTYHPMAIHGTARHCMERQNTLRHCTPRRCSALHGATLCNTAEAALTAPTFAWRCLGPCLQGEWRCWPPGPWTSDRACPVPAGRAACQRSTRHRAPLALVATWHQLSPVYRGHLPHHPLGNSAFVGFGGFVFIEVLF